VTLSLPDLPSSPTTEQLAQSTPDAVDFDALVAGDSQTGVVTGCVVSQRAAGANMSVDVSAGVVTVLGVDVAVAAVNKVISNGHATLNRLDLITVSSAGVVSVTAGTAAANPVFPAIPAGSVLLAAVWVAAANSTSIVTADIVSKRVLIATYLNGMLNTTPLADVAIGATQELLCPSGLSIPAGVSVAVAAGGVLDAGLPDLRNVAWGLQAYVTSGVTSANITTTETDVLWCDIMRARSDRVYRISGALALASSVAGDEVITRVYTRRGATSTLRQTAYTTISTANEKNPAPILAYLVGEDDSWRVVVTVTHNAGTGNVTMFGGSLGLAPDWLAVEDVGPAQRLVNTGGFS
jgi:hypothetical protein